MICKQCAAAGALNLAALDLAQRNGDRFTDLTVRMRFMATELHYECPDSRCPCQHKNNVGEGIDVTRLTPQKLPIERSESNGTRDNDEASTGEIR